MKITKAARVFGGLRAEQCSQKFTFGHEGKPSTAGAPGKSKSKPVAFAATLWLRKLCVLSEAGNIAALLKSRE